MQKKKIKNGLVEKRKKYSLIYFNKFLYLINKLLLNYLILLLKFFRKKNSLYWFFINKEILALDNLENKKLNKYEQLYKIFIFEIENLDYNLNLLKKECKEENKKIIYKLEILLHNKIKLYKKYFYKYKNLYLYIEKKRYLFQNKETLYVYKKYLYKIFLRLMCNSKILNNITVLKLLEKKYNYKINKKELKIIKKFNKYKLSFYKKFFKIIWKEMKWPKILKKKNKKIKVVKFENYETFFYFSALVETTDWWMIRGWLDAHKNKFIKYNINYTIYGYFFEFLCKGFYFYIKNIIKKK